MSSWPRRFGVPMSWMPHKARPHAWRRCRHRHRRPLHHYPTLRVAPQWGQQRRQQPYFWPKCWAHSMATRRGIRSMAALVITRRPSITHSPAMICSRIRSRQPRVKWQQQQLRKSRIRRQDSSVAPKRCTIVSRQLPQHMPHVTAAWVEYRHLSKGFC